jgi:uncharacterized protein (DUF58 family)
MTMKSRHEKTGNTLARERDLPGLLAKVEPLAARQFVIAIRRLANDLTYGMDGSRYLGSGIDYVQSRIYMPGDPIKSIDWRVTARTGKVFVKQYEAPRRIPAWFVIDTSASMVVSSVATSKYEQALHVAGGLAFACLDRMSPVGVLGAGERDVRIEPSLARDQVLQWLLRLRRHAFDEGTMLARRLAELRPTLKGRSLIIVCSDLHEAGCRARRWRCSRSSTKSRCCSSRTLPRSRCAAAASCARAKPSRAAASSRTGAVRCSTRRASIRSCGRAASIIC